MFISEVFHFDMRATPTCKIFFSKVQNIYTLIDSLIFIVLSNWESIQCSICKHHTSIVVTTNINTTFYCIMSIGRHTKHY